MPHESLPLWLPLGRALVLAGTGAAAAAGGGGGGGGGDAAPCARCPAAARPLVLVEVVPWGKVISAVGTGRAAGEPTGETQHGTGGGARKEAEQKGASMRRGGMFERAWKFWAGGGGASHRPRFLHVCRQAEGGALTGP